MDIRRGVIRGYDRETHTATIEVAGAQTTYLDGVPVSHALGWWLVVEGAQCGIIFFDETDTSDACVAFIYGGQPPADPHFDPSLGHRHRGLPDDGPTL
jgi:hypothetical protein